MVVNVVVQDGHSITGLIQEGSNVTITGNGTATAPYVISASGGGGGSGDRGWSPLIRSVIDGERRVQEIYDWTGGQGVKPTITGYIGATGIVQDISLATDIRGDKGQDGAPGIQGEKGDKGDPGNDGESAYQIWLDEGNTGSEQDFIDSLKGERGEQGIQGVPGADGADGEQGPKGDKGDKGDPGTTDYDELINKPDLGTAAFADSSSFATAAQGAKADTAVQPSAIAAMVESKQEEGKGFPITNYLAITQEDYDALTVKNPTTTYDIIDQYPAP